MAIWKRISYFVIIAPLFLSACLGPVKNPEGKKYVLQARPIVTAQAAERPVTLLVLPTETNPLYDTTKMIYVSKPYQVSYFARHEWALTPSEMLLPLIVITLQNTHYFKGVIMQPYLGPYDYVLRTRILSLQQNLTTATPRAEFTLEAQLFRANTNQLIATRVWHVTKPMWQVTPYQGILATNRATNELLIDLAHFCIKNT